MAFLFDTDAVSEALKPRPAPAYMRWLATVSKAEQFVSAVTVAELFEGAHRLADPRPYATPLSDLVLPAFVVLAVDTEVAKLFGRLAGGLFRAGTRIADMDLMIAATAIAHDLEMVTGNIRHFDRVPGLRICYVLADARR